MLKTVDKADFLSFRKPAFTFYCSSHSEKQRIRQAVAVNIKEEKAKSKPVITAPATLVAAKVIANSITAKRIVPNIPISTADRGVQQVFLRLSAVASNNTAK